MIIQQEQEWKKEKLPSSHSADTQYLYPHLNWLYPTLIIIKSST